MWKIRFSLKIKIFVWLVLKWKVRKMDNLLKRGWGGEESFAFCRDKIETVHHLFTRCQSTRLLLEGLLRNKLALLNCTAIRWLWKASSLKSEAPRGWELLSISTIWWVIWLERNRRTFEKITHTPGQVMPKICSLWCLGLLLYYYYYYYFIRPGCLRM